MFIMSNYLFTVIFFRIYTSEIPSRIIVSDDVENDFSENSGYSTGSGENLVTGFSVALVGRSNFKDFKNRFRKSDKHARRYRLYEVELYFLLYNSFIFCRVYCPFCVSLDVAWLKLIAGASI